MDIGYWVFQGDVGGTQAQLGLAKNAPYSRPISLQNIEYPLPLPFQFNPIPPLPLALLARIQKAAQDAGGGVGVLRNCLCPPGVVGHPLLGSEATEPLRIGNLSAHVSATRYR